ncbi:E3 ubiquitin-protein ligase RAD18 isoform X2 [Sphaeramia orbicularis]|uniref:E3 ubiquitin-protein ligase RAD18 isoform X2 n=1 Tax=Sphaeramia orbicularis TaxID=375764 RepID=UPI0011811DE0|nr:E3 ubiquitin-protein ligase RAD18 isoform X2 [Sphaeramia orbicularis]
MAFHMDADLPPGLACLKNVDTLLRCPICFDFLNISMMTKCSHNFCSLCIRKFFSYKLQCPVCNVEATEQDLRNNRLLDELVISFQTARQQLSKTTFESPPISPKTPASTVKCKTPREKGQKTNSSVLSHFFQKKPKVSPCKKPEQDTSLYVKEEPMDVEAVPVYSLIPVKKEDTDLCSIGDETAHSSTPLKDRKPTVKVECPVCSVNVPQNFINKHLDTCLTRGEKKGSLRGAVESRRHPLPKLVYNLLSMQELKRRLKQCHLSVQGSRDQLIKRHREFVHIYNSQCDSLNPKSAEAIAKEVEANEKIRNQLMGKAKPVLVFSKNQSEKEIDEMHSNYRKQHSSDFSRLIAQVRGRLETKRQTCMKRETNDEESEHTTRSADDMTDSKSSLVLKLEDRAADEEPASREILLSSSPTYSDVSISRDPEKTLVQEVPSSLRRAGASLSPASGKRRRKT